MSDSTARNSATHCFDARHTSCTQVREWLEAFCSAIKASDRTTMQLTLVIEELFTNTLKHGYGSEQPALTAWPVWLTLQQMENSNDIGVRYEDAAFAFNPLENICPPDYTGPAESWRIGGLGLPMIAGTARQLHYKRVEDRNQLSLTIAG